MKVYVLAEHLQKKLPYVSHAISTRSQLPILLHFLLETRDDTLFISATDLEIGIETNIPASIEVEGGVAVPAKLFVELINSLPSDKVLLEVVGNTLEVSTKRTKSSLQTLSKEEFPVLYEEKGTLLANSKTEDLKKYLSRVVFSASIDSSRPALSGMLLKQTEQDFSFVATDGYRLSLQNHIASGVVGEGNARQLIIPSRVIREVISLKQDANTHMYVSKKNNQILFFQEETVLVGRLIESDFPKYEKIIPSEFSTKVVFDKDDMQKAVKACAIFARDAGNIIKFVIEQDKIVVMAHTPSVGQNRVEVESRLEGETKEIAFNAKYLQDLFSMLEDQTIELEMTGPLNPGVFRIVGDTSFLHLIMPIKTEV